MMPPSPIISIIEAATSSIIGDGGTYPDFASIVSPAAGVSAAAGAWTDAPSVFTGRGSAGGGATGGVVDGSCVELIVSLGTQVVWELW